jgi:hypothetical protein
MQDKTKTKKDKKGIKVHDLKPKKDAKGGGGPGSHGDLGGRTDLGGRGGR